MGQCGLLDELKFLAQYGETPLVMAEALRALQRVRPPFLVSTVY